MATRWTDSKVLIIARTNGTRYFGWVFSVGDARAKAVSDRRRLGAWKWAAVFDPAPLNITHARDWEAISPETHAAQVLAHFVIADDGTVSAKAGA